MQWRPPVAAHASVPTACAAIAGQGKIARAIELGTKLQASLGNLDSRIQQKELFLDAIKQIAVNIKEFLDVLTDNALMMAVPGDDRPQLDQHRRALIKSGKTFSDMLKAYFKDESARSAVFSTAEALISETRTILAILCRKS